jgi:hypothetical protein
MKPWMEGPSELLEHAIDHLSHGSAFDLRIALISIDSAVELTIKTFLGLPRRVRGTPGPWRRRLQEASNSFPDLIDLLEEHAPEKIDGIELGEIEWYHRLRNTMYHDGNGITVPKEQVDGYLQIARLLVQGLFGEPPPKSVTRDPVSAIGEIVLKWSEVEHNLRILGERIMPGQESYLLSAVITAAVGLGVLPQEIVTEFDELRKVRNEIVHGSVPKDAATLEQLERRIDALARCISLV